MKKKFLLLPLAALFSLMACQKPVVPDRAVIDLNKNNFKIGILQPITHAALDEARVAFENVITESVTSGALHDLGKTVTFRRENPEGDPVALTNLAKSIAADSDMMLGVATDPSQALKNARDEFGTKQPILFTAVTDPVAAGLIKKFPHHDGSVTGTSDDNPVEAQINLILKCLTKTPSQIKLGILYTGSEVNSEVQAKRAKKAAVAAGFNKNNVKNYTCTNVSDLASVAEKASRESDVIYIPTDNLMAANTETIKTKVDSYNTLCVVGEANMLSAGHITYSVSYDLLGKRTGEMAIEILTGLKKTHEIDAEKMMDDEYLSKKYNSANFTSSGLTVPQEVIDEFEDVA